MPPKKRYEGEGDVFIRLQIKHGENITELSFDFTDCHPESIWKCDRPRHAENEQMRADYIRAQSESRKVTAPILAEMQRQRRKGLDESLHKGLA